ncbi:creatininase family protein [Streptomyces hoynatensis]|uniref:Creatininase family protein n=1 Tax=Streptomyces hoynatensis TaxID=1141874 RepID=A0A3A9YSV6_9ACTN|nr:creatininase family protein [Streptomyces hoynatensis]
MTRFPELTAPEVARLPAGTLALLPIGAIEQHGPHLPVATDHLMAEAVAERAALAAAGSCDITLLPGLAYAKSNEHAWSPGTLWLSADTLFAVLDDLGRALSAGGVRRLAFLNAHGGNSALLGVALRELRAKYGLFTFLLHASLPADQGGSSPAAEQGMGVHGGLHETSALLHLRPDLVRMELATRSVPEHLGRYEHIGFGKAVAFGWLSDDFGTGNGVIGDPTGATAELGRRLVDGAVARAAAALRECARFHPGPPATPHSEETP